MKPERSDARPEAGGADTLSPVWLIAGAIVLVLLITACAGTRGA